MKYLIALLSVLAATTSVATEKAIVDKYNRTCIACHASGAAGAPRSFQVAQWTPRLEKGMPVLLQSVDKGLNAMPPKGLCMDCTPKEVEALIVYMSAPKS